MRLPYAHFCQADSPTPFALSETWVHGDLVKMNNSILKMGPSLPESQSPWKLEPLGPEGKDFWKRMLRLGA